MSATFLLPSSQIAQRHSNSHRLLLASNLTAPEILPGSPSSQQQSPLLPPTPPSIPHKLRLLPLLPSQLPPSPSPEKLPSLPEKKLLPLPEKKLQAQAQAASDVATLPSPAPAMIPSITSPSGTPALIWHAEQSLRGLRR